MREREGGSMFSVCVCVCVCVRFVNERACEGALRSGSASPGQAIVEVTA